MRSILCKLVNCVIRLQVNPAIARRTTYNIRAMADSPPAKKIKTESKAIKAEVSSTASGDFISEIAEKRKACSKSVAEFKFNKKRVRVLSSKKDFPEENEGVVYWMFRDQRVQDNWAFLYAQKLAIQTEVPLYVCFCLEPKHPEATLRHYVFMLKGLKEIEQECFQLDISFHLLIGHAKEVLPEFVKTHKIGGVVTDFSPLRVPLALVEEVKSSLPAEIPFCQVDAHNIVPCWEASPKLEYGARTIRNKINNQLSTYLTEFPPVIKHPHPSKAKPEPTDWEATEASLEVDRSVQEVDWAVPGTTGGLRNLECFIKERLRHFDAYRNNPNKDALSHMSPWFHFGQVSVARAMLSVKKYRSKYSKGVEGYMEEGIVRRELADNFCYYNKNYDNIEGANAWAKDSLEVHKNDKREYIYTRQQLEEAKTHDDLWNAAQIQMVTEGKMHGFLRMYWAKKILEWTETPEIALSDAIYLNDKYELDGQDPNGYVGCMWSICGIHDQGWAERPVFGKIRFMNYNGCKRKFDVAEFVAKYKPKTKKS